MRLRVGVLVACLAFLGLSGCISMPSEFEYAGDANASARVVMPEPLRIVSVNGKAVTLPALLEYPYTATLDAGVSTLGFQYIGRWGVGDENELVRGPIMELTFDTRAGEEYKVDYTRPADVRFRTRAEAYLESFSAWVSDNRGLQTAAVSTGTAGNVRIDLAGSLGTSSSATGTAVATTAVEPAPVASSRLESLQALWMSADEDEKKAFMQWIVAPGS